MAQDSQIKNEQLADRIEILDSKLQQQLEKMKLPGLAFALVVDDKVVFAKGYGLSDIHKQKPVSADTLFAIGSTTKAFTSTLVGMLADEKKLNLDDPISRYIPDFEPAGDRGDQEITIRDVLCHRSGFSRMGLLWAGGKTDWRQVLELAENAEPFGEFRKDFIYNNVMYMAGGRCAGVAAESSWESLVKSRIFRPLGMNSSGTGLEFLKNSREVASGYLWDSDREEFTKLPQLNSDAVGPSGSIVSSANDMATWVRLQLGQGEFEGTRLISKKQLTETWSRQMQMQDDVYYGLGWMLRNWNGSPVVEHGGSVNGYAAQVTLLPEYDAGYVLLTNVTATPLQQGSIKLVFDTLFKPEGEQPTPSTESAANRKELVGNYIANFATFNNATFKVLEKDGALALDVPGQQVFLLNEPDNDGKWYFEMTDQIAVSFNRDSHGEVISITMHQGGMQPEFIREGVVLKPESPASTTTPLLGKYQEIDGENVIEIELRNGRLVIDAGQTAFTLLPPDEDGKWALRARPDRMQIRFNKDDKDSVKSLTRIRGQREIEMLRIADEVDSSEDNHVDVSALIAKACAAFGNAEKEFVAIRLVGTAHFVHQGAQGSIETIYSTSGDHATRMDFGMLGQIQSVYDGVSAVQYSTFNRYEELAGKKLKQAAAQSPRWILDWQKHYDHAEVIGQRDVAGRNTHLIRFTSNRLSPRQIFVDAETGRILREKTSQFGDAIGEVPVEIEYSDFRNVDGVVLAHKTTTSNRFIGDFVVSIEKVELLDELPEDALKIENPQAGVTDSTPLAIVNQRMAAYNRHDIDEFLDLYSDDIAIFTYPDRHLGQGRDHLKRIFEPLFAEGKAHVEVHAQIVKDSFVINHETVDYGDRQVEYVSIYEVRDGLIQSVRFVRD